jgi:hypothetical protein
MQARPGLAVCANQIGVKRTEHFNAHFGTCEEDVQAPMPVSASNGPEALIKIAV